MAEINEDKPNVSVSHIIVVAIATLLAWVSTCTVLLPFFLSLLLSENLRKKFFSWLFCTFFAGSFTGFIPIRKKLFELLATDQKFKLLEIGVGGGANFEYYPEGCDVTLLDMNENFADKVQARLAEFSSFNVEKTVIAMAEDMKGVPDAEYDVVVCTHVLCSVTDVSVVLKEVGRVLKKDGKFLYMEHVAFPPNEISYWIQVILSPLWRVYMNGCCLDRYNHEIISDYFSQNSYKITYPQFLPLIFRPHVNGIATK